MPVLAPDLHHRNDSHGGLFDELLFCRGDRTAEFGHKACRRRDQDRNRFRRHQHGFARQWLLLRIEPLRIDYGIPVIKDNNKGNGRFNFNVGYQF